MPRGTAIVSSLTVDLTQRERDFCDHMRAATGLTSDQNLLRVALFRLAVHLDVPVTIDTFRIRGESGRRRNYTRWPRSKQAKRSELAALPSEAVAPEGTRRG